MRINGIEITKEEELKLAQKEVRSLREVIKTADYRKGASAVDLIRIENTRVRHLKNQIKLVKLQEKLFAVRNNKEYDRIDSEMEKLREEISGYHSHSRITK